jgi:tetraacyldisaccharide 4'-kinase
MTRADVGNWRDVVETIEAATGRAAQPILSQFRAETLIDVATGEVRQAETLAGRTVVAFSGIGNPASFRALLERLGFKIGGEVIFADHHDYTAADLETVRERARHGGADMIVTTEKDAGKIAPLLKSGEQVWAVRLSLEILSGRERFERLVLGNDEVGTMNDERGERCIA